MSETVIVSYRMTLVDEPTPLDPRGVLQNGKYIQEIVKILPQKPLYMFVAQGQNVRSGPSTRHKIRRTLENGDLVMVYEIRSGWAMVGEKQWIKWVEERFKPV